jgi:hypothetical protein
MANKLSSVSRATLSITGLSNPWKLNAAILLINPSSNPYPQTFIHSISKLLNVQVVGALNQMDHAFSLALVNGVPFYSNAGRQIKSKSVGRWRFNSASHEQNMGKFESISQGPGFTSNVIPIGLENMSKDPDSIITFSDNEPIELYQYLHHAYPDSLKVQTINLRWV